MTLEAQAALYQGYLVRTVEQELLQLFAAGKLKGTVHTCIGQEMSAVALAAGLDAERDVIFSNHRCHGHYLAWTDDVEGLIAEVMGKPSGVCAGIGGSQHLCARGFFSNGVQGGIVPVAAGFALAQKRAACGGIVAVCIGDGTLGEGVVYEAFNIAAKWRLPLLILLENNSYAQSTAQGETLAGDICARASAFGMRTFQGDTWNPAALAETVRASSRYVRSECAPAFVRVDTYRLAAHSKGDDDRDAAEIARYMALDPISQMLSASGSSQDSKLTAIQQRVRGAVRQAEAEQPQRETIATSRAPSSGWGRPRDSINPASCRSTGGPPKDEPFAGTQLQAINRALRDWMQDDPRVVLIGEDIRSPYGGAFKVTKGLSDLYPDRVFNAPISEAAIVGIGNGLSLAGQRPVVEIMFGDFLTLCFDQILNHAAKFHGMYNGRVTSPVVIRAPMGGGRGYGPTHSQSLEKHFVGIPGIMVIVLHHRARIADLYRWMRQCDQPVLLIENKLLYGERADAPPPAGYTIRESDTHLPATLLQPNDGPDITLVAFGRMGVLAERALARLALEEEIFLELILPLQISPFDPAPILASVSKTSKLLVVEEGTEGFDLGAEVLAAASCAHRGPKALRCRRIAALATPIPSAPNLEQQVLPDDSDIFTAALELFDE